MFGRYKHSINIVKDRRSTPQMLGVVFCTHMTKYRVVSPVDRKRKGTIQKRHFSPAIYRSCIQDCVTIGPWEIGSMYEICSLVFFMLSRSSIAHNLLERQCRCSHIWVESWSERSYSHIWNANAPSMLKRSNEASQMRQPRQHNRHMQNLMARAPNIKPHLKPSLRELYVAHYISFSRPCLSESIRKMAYSSRIRQCPNQIQPCYTTQRHNLAPALRRLPPTAMHHRHYRAQSQ